MDTITEADKRQVGGVHYKKGGYEHWNWVLAINMGYLLGCASKYLVRWRNKNGVLDLKKAGHYLQKQIEHVSALQANKFIRFPVALLSQECALYLNETTRFVEQNSVTISGAEAAIFYLLIDGADVRRLSLARVKLNALIDEAEQNNGKTK